VLVVLLSRFHFELDDSMGGAERVGGGGWGIIRFDTGVRLLSSSPFPASGQELQAV